MDLEGRFNIALHDADADAAERRFLETAGVFVPELGQLSSMIHGDLDERASGILWWREHVDAQRSVLISDHLVCAVDAIQTNLAEGSLHLSEAENYWTGVDRKHARIIEADGRRTWPQASNVAELLPEKLAVLHTAGFFRAVGSVIDCLAAASIGVAAVSDNLLRADFERLRRWLNREIKPTTSRHAIHDGLRVCVDDGIGAAGPVGWLRWASDYRNMFVHRGRRTELVKVELEARILDAQGRYIPKANSVRLLLRDPAASEIQGLTEFRKTQLTLTEPAERTMRALLESTKYLTQTIARHLCGVWSRRRSEPDLLKQPLEQWPELDSASVGFEGYEPGTTNLAATHIVGHPSLGQRIRAAGLSSDHNEGSPDAQKKRIGH